MVRVCGRHHTHTHLVEDLLDEFAGGSKDKAAGPDDPPSGSALRIRPRGQDDPPLPLPAGFGDLMMSDSIGSRNAA